MTRTEKLESTLDLVDSAIEALGPVVGVLHHDDSALEIMDSVQLRKMFSLSTLALHESHKAILAIRDGCKDLVGISRALDSMTAGN